MKNTVRRTLTLACSLLFVVISARAARITIGRAPNDSIQPQAVLDANGALHLIYLTGEPGTADINYTRQSPGRSDFAPSIRVNTEPGSAIAIGTIRGAQLALGGGRVHVAWNGHAPKNGTYMQAPMLFTRLNDAGAAFEHERNVITFAGGLDGGGSLAADDKGNVFVTWHAPRPGNTNGEAGRAVFVARSRDNGKTFTPEKLASPESLGACGCCGMKTFLDQNGTLFALFRSARGTVNRDEVLLASRNGVDFEPVFQHPWKTPACPMSSAAFAPAGGATLAAWESEGNVYFAEINNLKVGTPHSPTGNTKRKHPAVAANNNGEILLAWTEGTAWGKGGKVVWQLFDKEGRTIENQMEAPGLSAWSLPTVVAKPDNSFLLFY